MRPLNEGVRTSPAAAVATHGHLYLVESKRERKPSGHSSGQIANFLVLWRWRSNLPEALTGKIEMSRLHFAVQPMFMRVPTTFFRRESLRAWFDEVGASCRGPYVGPQECWPSAMDVGRAKTQGECFYWRLSPYRAKARSFLCR
jgi:hypothetical protein